MLSGHREKKHRVEDQDRADKNNQRQAVAYFIRAVRKINSSINDKKFAIKRSRPIPGLSEEEVTELGILKLALLAEFKAEMEVLGLQLHDKELEQSYNDMVAGLAVSTLRFWQYAERYEEGGGSPTEGAAETLEELFASPISSEFGAAFNQFRKTAHSRLRLNPEEEFEGLFTPFGESVTGSFSSGTNQTG